MRDRSPRGTRIGQLRRRGRLSPASVISCLALFIALAGGTAYGAKHYLISSTKQIKPSVRKALRGKTGPRGATGVTGATGATGSVGTLLPSGKTQTGTYFAAGTATAIGDLAASPISFPVPLASSPTPTIVAPGTTTASCSGSVSAPSAAPGALCVYVGAQPNVGESSIYDPYGDPGDTTSPYGAGIIVDSTGSGNFSSVGTWAVTAP
jgi:hypothetical protein